MQNVKLATFLLSVVLFVNGDILLLFSDIYTFLRKKIMFVTFTVKSQFKMGNKNTHLSNFNIVL